METAFGRALISSLDNNRLQSFTIQKEGAPPIQENCSNYFVASPDHMKALEQIAIPASAAVLDYGCGLGRHLKYLRSLHPDIYCYGIDQCELMRDHCCEAIDSPYEFVPSLKDLTQEKFDLILLMGNGLGILGDKESALQGLKDLTERLNKGGQLLIETGNPFGKGYTLGKFTISFEEHRDDFHWGYADKDWIEAALTNLGFDLEFFEVQAFQGHFFLVNAKLPPPGGSD